MQDERNPASMSATGPLETGSVLAGRFLVEQLAGRGGMGVVFRGRDLLTGAAVAIKLATPERQGSSSRFAQEVAVLARLSHPAIVRYVTAGREPAGGDYLVMEWLQGETLASRLTREPLSFEESVRVLRQCCEGLAVAHAAGVVHRDLKPGNLFLVNAAIDQLKLLDFGIARQRDSERTITQSGTVLGTLGYMAPEQALGARDIDARADVFALGCLFFECLVGRAAFTGANAVAVMAKVLHDEVPDVRQLRPELAEPWAALLARMLSKDVAQRPADAGEVLRALRQIEPVTRTATTQASPPGLTSTERKVVSVILGRLRDEPEAAAELVSETFATPAEPGAVEQVEQIAHRFGCQPLFLRGGALMVVLADRGAVTDQSAQAARCALALQAARPDLRFSVATGRAETGAQLPIGGAIDRAAELLTGAPQPARGIAIDEITSALLEQSFVVLRDGQGLSMIEERSEQQAARLLLGRPTPFVGRSKELSLLERTWSECLEDSIARVALVLGSPGQGKSRLSYELVAQVRARASACVLSARADPVGAGSALMLVRQLVRGAIGAHGGEPAREQQARLRSHLDTLVAAADVPRLAEFLGELIGAPSSERPSPELRAARNDPQIMSVWLRRCFGQWLSAECARQPVLIVLEDLHWGDAASVLYLGEALRASSNQPLLLLALARPELQDTFPKLWAALEPQLIRLSRLTPRSAERLVCSVLGAHLPKDAVARIVERADGNPFHLEELIRRVAEGDTERLPETVLALVQTRLARLEPSERRCVRAASVFGETFWVGGLAAVLGPATPRTELTYAIQRLLEEELIHASDESRFPDEREYRFRHGLLREAAYAMLTERDRQSGHALAGEWLERCGEQDALTLAQHFGLGGLPRRAVPWLLAAAQAAADGGNVDAALDLAQRGLDSGAQGLQRGRLHLVCAEGSIMRAQWSDAVRESREAAASFAPGSALWFKAAAGPLLAGTFLGDRELTQQAVEMVMSVPLDDEATGPYGLALFWVCQALLNVSQLPAAEAILARAEALADASPDADPVFRMWLLIARSFAQLLRSDLGALAVLSEARELAERTGAGFGRALAAMYGVAAAAQTGDEPATAAAAALARAASEPTGLHVANDWASYFHALVYVRASTPKQVLQAHTIAPLRALSQRGDHRLALTAQNLLALALLLAGEPEQAERLALDASSGARFPQELATTLAVRAHIELQLGRPPRALELAEQGLAAAQAGAFPWSVTLLLVSRARALHELDRGGEARSAIAAARDTVLRVAATIRDVQLRQSFLTNIDANALALELADAWLPAG